MIPAVLCPHPPLLLEELGGLDDPGAELRESCVAALRQALTDDLRRIHLVGADDPRGPWVPGGLPLSLTVGDRLLDLAGWTGERVRHLATDSLPEPEVGSLVLVLADGTARRGEAAPGHLDVRAASYDAVIDDALRGARADVLEALDLPLGEALMAQGVPALRVLGGLGRRFGVGSAMVHYADDPYGVFYWVATWELGAERRTV